MWYGDLGINGKRLEEYTTSLLYQIFVDIGVRDGISSKIFIEKAKRIDGVVYGIDFDRRRADKFQDVPFYHFIHADSVTIGKWWPKAYRPDFIMVDSTHMFPITICELYYWWPLLKVNGVIAFHDTCWPEGKKEICGDKIYDRVDDALKVFFDTETLNYENKYVKMETFSESWGMTFITKKSEYDFADLNMNYRLWTGWFQERAYILKAQSGDSEDWHLQCSALCEMEIMP